MLHFDSNGALTPRSCSDLSHAKACHAIHGAGAVFAERTLPLGVALLVTGSHARRDTVSDRDIEVIVVGRGKPSRMEERSPSIVLGQEIPHSPPTRGSSSVTHFHASSDPASGDPELMEISFRATTPGEDFVSETPRTPCRSSTTKETEIPSELAEKAGVIRGIIQQNPHLFSSSLEVFQLDGGETPLRCHNGRDHRVIPSCALDAVLLAGELEVFEQYRLLAFHDLIRLNSKRRKDFERHFIDPAKQALSECVQGKTVLPVDYRNGTLHFDGDRIMSTKYVLLRPVQYHIMALLIHHVHGKEELAEEFSKEMPFSITHRIQWMHDRKIISEKTSVTTLQEAYLKALSWYELSSRKYAENSTRQVNVDPVKLQEVARTIHAFIQDNPVAEIRPATPAKIARAALRHQNPSH